ncbi:MAG: cytochrome c oxidase accessory protein CcoG [Xanthobacteraceae bacterium]|nr:MAG: cytochrome c oxidase accessory protein CcoG [Xanthobacteraceae bacterium]
MTASADPSTAEQTAEPVVGASGPAADTHARIKHIGIKPVDYDAEHAPLYAPQRKVYQQSVSGTFRRIKWILLVITLGIYYFLPFVRWDRGPDAPSQAVLIDFPSRRFYFFFIEIWPQEVYYITGLLIIAALALFLMNALAGRVWCGYLCWQTVWTDLFFATERFFEGDRREQMRAATSGWTPRRVVRKVAKHITWLTIAWWTGGAWVLYFADAPTLVRELATGEAPFIAYASIGLLTFTTYIAAGFMREQICIYMCPWPRIQAALTDEHALNVTYRYDRGEPRMSVKKAAAARARGEPAGDCVDCDQCVVVCPVGIDIRRGLQLECIQCGLCIDACDATMKKLGREPRLIAYDTDINVHRREDHAPIKFRIVRTRTVIYAALIATVGLIMLYALMTRHDMGLKAIHDRNPIAVQLADGGIRNGYSIHLLNKQRETRDFVLTVEGMTDARLEVIGAERMEGGAPVITVGHDQTRDVRVLVTGHQPMDPNGSLPLTFQIRDARTGQTARTVDTFRAP